MSALAGNYTYYITAFLLAIGLYGMIGKKNLLKKLIGMNIFQTAIFLFFFAAWVINFFSMALNIIWQSVKNT